MATLARTNKKIRRGPRSAQAPVMQSPDRKGYTTPLDKSLAADGKGLQGVHISDNFAKVAEALLIADKKATEGVNGRIKIGQKVAQREKEKKEDELKKLAQRIRQDRTRIKRTEHEEEVCEREDLRRARQKERQRDRKIARAAPDKRNRLHRDKDRDISEKVALGLPNTGSSKELQFDQRLYNQSKGMDSGFGDEDGYTVYDKPWRGDRDMATSIYKPSKWDSDDYGGDLDAPMSTDSVTNRFVPDKGFEGTDRNTRRDGPVQFSREQKEEDHFGFDAFLLSAKRGEKRSTEDRRDYDRNKKRR